METKKVIPIIREPIQINIEKKITIYEKFRYFLVFRLLFGYNFVGFFVKSRIKRCFISLYCITLAFTVVYFVLTKSQTLFLPTYLCIVEYLGSVLFYCVAVEYERYNPFKIYDDIDTKSFLLSNALGDLRIQIYQALVVCFVIIVRIIEVYGYCSWSNYEPVSAAVTTYLLLAIDMIQLSRVIVYNFMFHRVQHLRKDILKISVERSAIFTYGQNESKLRKACKLYGKIHDNSQLISLTLNPMFMLSLVTCVPKILSFIYFILLFSKDQINPLFLVMSIVEVVEWVILLCLPGVVAEMTKAEVDKIKQSLLDQKMSTKDACIREELTEFLDYLERRPFEYKIWRLVSVDISLPVRLINLCTTYLIIIVQFTKLYE